MPETLNTDQLLEKLNLVESSANLFMTNIKEAQSKSRENSLEKGKRGRNHTLRQVSGTHVDVT
jgi:hypothetical protein